MGLGLNGGGVEAARYLAANGAEVTVTDLRDENVLEPSIKKLDAFPIRYVLGRHEMDDFRKADMVVKNPGARPDSPFLMAAGRIETDISLFLAASPARLLAVTGSKGKSTASSALYHVLNEGRIANHMERKAWLGGNIAISPLSFLEEVKEGDDVVLELSSWQLGDLGRSGFSGADGSGAGSLEYGLLKPRAAVITDILPDHLDWYGSMEAYVADKRIIYRNQDEVDATIAGDDIWGRSFRSESRARPLVYSDKPPDHGIAGGWIPHPRGPGFARLWQVPEEKSFFGRGEGSFNDPEAGCVVEIIPELLLIPGFHQKRNLLAAALALLDLGLPPDFIRESLGRFRGIEHRLEFFHESGGIRFYNDSAATIPEAAAAAVEAFPNPPLLVCGGTDKGLDFTPLARAAAGAGKIFLLAGTGTEKLKSLLDGGGIKYRGPFDSLDDIINAVMEAALPGDNVVFSPGCTSFGMFLNEFDRGIKWKEGVRKHR